MDEQTPFCPSCGAPQIRVSARTEQDASGSDSFNTAPPPPLDAAAPQFPAMSANLDPSAPVEWKRYLHLVLPMAVLVGASTAAWLPAGLLIFLPASVVLSIHLYRRKLRLGPIKPSLGARLGALTGLLGFIFFVVVFVVRVASHRAEYRETITKALKDAAARNPDPQTQQVMQSLFGGTAGIVLLTIVTLGFVLAFFLIVASIAGAVAAAVSRHKKTL